MMFWVGLFLFGFGCFGLGAFAVVFLLRNIGGFR